MMKEAAYTNEFYLNLLYLCKYSASFGFPYSRSLSQSLAHSLITLCYQNWKCVYNNIYFSILTYERNSRKMKRQIENKPTEIGNGRGKKCDSSVIINSIVIYAWISRKRHICSVTYPQFIFMHMDGPNAIHAGTALPAKSFDVKYCFDLFIRTHLFDTSPGSKITKPKKTFAKSFAHAILCRSYLKECLPNNKIEMMRIVNFNCWNEKFEASLELVRLLW